LQKQRTHERKKERERERERNKVGGWGLGIISTVSQLYLIFYLYNRNFRFPVTFIITTLRVHS
jgi:hypothetical protein